MMMVLLMLLMMTMMTTTSTAFSIHTRTTTACSLSTTSTTNTKNSDNNKYDTNDDANTRNNSNFNKKRKRNSSWSCHPINPFHPSFPHHLLTATTTRTTTTTDTDTLDTAAIDTEPTTITNNNIPTRVFLSHINYQNDTCNSTTSTTRSRTTLLSPEQVKEGLLELFSEYGTVQEIYLSKKTRPSRPSFGFVAMQTSEEAQLAIRTLTTTTTTQMKVRTDNDADSDSTNGGSAVPALSSSSSSSEQQQQQQVNKQKRRQLLRTLFRDIKLAEVYKNSNTIQHQRKMDQQRTIIQYEYQQRLSFISTRKSSTNDNSTSNSSSSTANIICQVHSSHVDRLKEYVLSLSSTTTIRCIGCFQVQKCTSLLFLRVDNDDNDNDNDNDNNSGSSRRSIDYLEQFSQQLWKTWYIAPNLNRITIINDDDIHNNNNNNNKVIAGTLRQGVVPAIFRSLVELQQKEDCTKQSPQPLRVRVAIFPPKLQHTLLQELDDYLIINRNQQKNNDYDVVNNVQFTPTHPTHTISIIQLHPGVDVVVNKNNNNKMNDNNNDNDNDNANDNDSDPEALYVLGRWETNQLINSNHAKKKQITTNQDETTSTTTTTIQNSKSKSHTSNISRAYWKLQEAWERYQYPPPCLLHYNDVVQGPATNNESSNRRKLFWALDCGAAPGGWTKYLFRPGVVERIYSIDPGKLSHAVVPGLDADNNKNNKRSTNIIKYMNTTIQKAIPLLVSELKEYNTGSTTHRRKYLDIWVSDMCVKEMSQQLDYFLLARQEGIIGKDTFFVITIKCYVGCSAASFEKQTKEQVQRLLTPIAPLARNVQVIHLFFNRNSERTIIGYLN